MESKLKHFKMKRKVKNLPADVETQNGRQRKNIKKSVCKKNSESHLADDYGRKGITFDRKMEYSKQNGTITHRLPHKNKQVLT